MNRENWLMETKLRDVPNIETEINGKMLLGKTYSFAETVVTHSAPVHYTKS